MDAERIVSLRDITSDTVRAVCALEVDDTQRRNVASNAISLAEAYVYYPQAWPRAIHAGEDLVGFLMVYDPTAVENPDESDFFLWRLMIDRRWQQRGYGRAAARLAIEYVRSRSAERILVAHVKSDPVLGSFYASFGFAYTGREDERQRYMALALR
jgi:diamine N-acetyltransferase